MMTIKEEKHRRKLKRRAEALKVKQAKKAEVEELKVTLAAASKKLKAYHTATEKTERLIEQTEVKIAKLSRRTVRQHGRKAKGSSYERKVLKMIVAAFAHHGVKENDVYRTILSGAKEVKGDLQVASNLLKLFPFNVECKNTNVINPYQYLMPMEEMQKSWKFNGWWRQLEKECVVTKRPGLLVFRENNGEDLCSFKVDELAAHYKISVADKVMSLPKIETYKLGKQVWVVPFKDFLRIVASKKGKNNGD